MIVHPRMGSGTETSSSTSLTALSNSYSYL